MANLNKVMLIGRLTRDPEVRMFANGGKVANFGFAVNNRKKNASTGQWEDDPVYLDCEAFNRGEFGKSADLIEQSVRKGQQIFIEGHLRLDQWNDKTDGQKRTKIKIVVDNFQYLEPRQDGGSGAPRGSYPARRPASAPASSMGGNEDSYDSGESMMDAPPPPAPGRSEDDIPF